MSTNNENIDNNAAKHQAMPVHENDEKDAFDLISTSSENSEPVEDAINNNASSTDKNATNSIEEVTAEKYNQFRDDDA